MSFKIGQLCQIGGRLGQYFQKGHPMDFLVFNPNPEFIYALDGQSGRCEIGAPGLVIGLNAPTGLDHNNPGIYGEGVILALVGDQVLLLPLSFVETLKD